MTAPRARLATIEPPPEEGEITETRKLIREDPFERLLDDGALLAVIERLERESATPYKDALGRLVGIELSESEARAFFRRMLEHRRQMELAMGRPVHARVAALDLVTHKPRGTKRRVETGPVFVTPSMLEKAFDAARADSLTGLPQRAHFMSLLRHELRQRKRRGVVVVYLDLDDFKRVNDAYGHARGDEVLCGVASVGRSVLRRGDVLARIGGDEFALMLVDVTLDEAKKAVDRLRRRFEADPAAAGTSFSAGVARAEGGDSADDVLARADDAMYRDKRARRART